MTIAIVAKVNVEGAFVAVSDRMVSWSDQIPAAENITKHFSLGKHWWAMYAGDVCESLPIIERARCNWHELADAALEAEIAKRGAPYQPPEHNSRLESREIIETAFCRAYQTRVAELIVGKYLARYGISSVDEFRQSGHAQFGDHVFSRLCDKIDEFDLGIDFIVYGFSSGGRSQIFEVTNPGFSTDRNALRYWAVGSGQLMALASLTSREFQQASIPEVTYRLCEAKFCAETASGVGKDTLVVVTNRHGQEAVISFDEDIDRLRSIWKRTHVAEPVEAVELIKERLPSHLNW
jgi:20S proteasome alpha/beta subunit